jgi:hypothetical protein
MVSQAGIGEGAALAYLSSCSMAISLGSAIYERLKEMLQ